MIEQGKIYHVTGPSELTRGAIIRVARSGISAGVVMGDNHPGAAELQRVGDNVSHGQADFCRLAGILLDMETAGRAVDMGNQQMLVLPIHTIKASGEEAARSFVTVEERW